MRQKILIAAIASVCFTVTTVSATTVMNFQGAEYRSIWDESNFKDRTVSTPGSVSVNYYVDYVDTYYGLDPAGNTVVTGGEYVQDLSGFFVYSDATAGSGGSSYVGTSYDDNSATAYDFFTMTIDFPSYQTSSSTTVVADVLLDSLIDWSETFYDYDGSAYDEVNDFLGGTAGFVITYNAPIDTGVTPVPVPAGGMLLLSAMGLLGWRFKRA